jgi:hypothetical protein
MEAMQHTKHLGSYLGLLTLLSLASALVHAQEMQLPGHEALGQGSVVVSTPTSSGAVLAGPPMGPATAAGYPTGDGIICQQCRPECNLYALYVTSGLKWPFEIYARVGGSFFTSNGELDGVLNDGIATQFGAKVIYYDHDCRAAWFGDLGVDYFHNQGDQTTPVIERFRFLDVNRGQQQFALLVLERSAIEALDRIFFRVGGGREWFFGGEVQGSVRYKLGLDGGLRLGHAHAGLAVKERNVIQSVILPGTNRPARLQDGDILNPTGNKEATDFVQNVFVGASVGVLIPYCGFDFVLDGRAEYSHDFISLHGIENMDQSLDQIQILLSAGLRY